MRCLLALGMVAALAAPVAAATASDAPIKPLRSLVYEINYSAHSSHEKKTSGFNGSYGSSTPGGGVGIGSGNGTAGVGLDGNDSGKLTIDVIAATPDGGLVVDTAYAGTANSQPKVRVALYPDGRISADPSKPIGPEAAHLLPLLARGFIANRDVTPGSSWSVPATPPMRGSTTYRVSALDGQQATIALEGSITMPGINGFDETDRGTTKYATDLVSPVAYDLNARIHRQLGVDESITTDTHLTATLLSDTFAKK